MEAAATALEKMSLLYFYSDVKVSEMPELMAAALLLILQNGLVRQRDRMEEYLKFCMEEFLKTSNEIIRKLFDQVRADLTAKGQQEFAVKYLRLGPPDSD